MGLDRPPTLLELPAYVANQVARAGRRDLAEVLDRHDLRLPHYATLTALFDFGPLPQHELAERLGFNRSHAVGYLDRVQELGLIRRERDPHDRRRQRILLTEAGRQLCTELQPVARQSQQRFLAVLSADERATLHDLLLRVLAANDDAPR